MDDSASLDCDLCVVGAGYAALNGLNVAAKYLSPGARVVLIDKYATWGGQWTHQYDFVRLHQPYPMFTAGDQKWTLPGREKSYLATRREVLDNLATVPERSAGHLDVKPLFRHEYVRHTVREGRAEVSAKSLVTGGGTVKIRAKRLLKATGTDITSLPPLGLSSTKVRSVAVSDPVLMSPEFLQSPAPVYVIGSGKTAMDAVLHVAQGSRGKRPIHVVTGSGMYFFVRDAMFPKGAERHLRGTLTGDLFLHMAALFEGENEGHVMRTLEQEGTLFRVFRDAGNCRFGILSRAEKADILANVTEIHAGHLLDVDVTTMTLSVGKEQRKVPVPEGSWFINCTSHFHELQHEPVLQDSGITCAPQGALGFTGTSAYYVTHLWFLNELAPIAGELFRVRVMVDPKVRFAPQMALMVVANLGLIGPRLPFSVPSKFEGDFHKWYPLHRQIPTLARIMKTRAEMIRKAERILKLRYSDAPEYA